MRIARPVIALALCGSLLAVGSASAASKPSGLPKARSLSWTDPGGDANGINDQGGVSPANPSTATPVQAAGADIVGVSFNRVDDGKKVKGLQVVMTLASAPMPNVLYRVTGSVKQLHDLLVPVRDSRRRRSSGCPAAQLHAEQQPDCRREQYGVGPDRHGREGLDHHLDPQGQ